MRIFSLTKNNRRPNSGRTVAGAAHHPHQFDKTPPCSAVRLCFQISTWRPCRTRATPSIKPWGWEAWGRCSAASTPAAAPTASPGPPTTETAAPPRPPASDRSAVFGPRWRDGRTDTEKDSISLLSEASAATHRGLPSREHDAADAWVFERGRGCSWRVERCAWFCFNYRGSLKVKSLRKIGFRQGSPTKG